MCRQDTYYFTLFQLPELLILSILAAPTLMARIALAYPRVQDVPDPRDSCTSGSDSSSDLEAGGHSGKCSGSCTGGSSSDLEPGGRTEKSGGSELV